MAVKPLKEDEAEVMGLRRQRRLPGIREVWRFAWDRRLHLLRRADGWHVGVAWYEGCLGEAFEDGGGPFPAPGEAAAAARAWHLDHPRGRLAELLAACDCPPGLRSLLHGVNEHGVWALGGVYDLLLEAGLGEERWAPVSAQLEAAGVLPVGADGELIGKAPPWPW